MTTALVDLEPKPVWKHFDALAAIPRPSTKEAAARNYVLALAARLGLEAVHDDVGNTVIRKPARPGREGAPMALLQGHLDMVCEKNEGTAHNFDTDAIKLVRKDDWLTADGTTLGADNGVGVAAALAVMESTDIAHGPLEFVFTIDEETGLTGAAEFPGGMLQSKYFLNLDNEEKGTLCIGCSGGIKTMARRKVALRPAGAGAGFRIKVSGLKGGHSGVDIHQGRGNALRILGGVLQSALDRLSVEIAEINGGSAQNAIPREASAVVVLDAAREKELKSLAATAEAEGKSDLGGFDPGLQITVEKVDKPAKVFDATDARNTVALLITVPHGVLAMSPDVPGPDAELDQPGHCLDQRRRGGVRHQPAQRHRQQHAVGGAHGGHRLPPRGIRGGALRRLSGMEARAQQRDRAQAAGRPRGAVRRTRQADCHARRAGVRRDRRKVSRDADGVVRPDHRRSPQPQRAGADLLGGELLEVSEGGAGEDMNG